SRIPQRCATAPRLDLARIPSTRRSIRWNTQTSATFPLPTRRSTGYDACCQQKERMVRPPRLPESWPPWHTNRDNSQEQGMGRTPASKPIFPSRAPSPGRELKLPPRRHPGLHRHRRPDPNWYRSDQRRNGRGHQRGRTNQRNPSSKRRGRLLERPNPDHAHTKQTFIPPDILPALPQGLPQRHFPCHRPRSPIPCLAHDREHRTPHPKHQHGPRTNQRTPKSRPHPGRRHHQTDHDGPTPQNQPVSPPNNSNIPPAQL
ncbi:hypothetical protein Q9L58_010488, partial [Maublancomyces gigas]